MHASGYHHRDLNATHILLHCAHDQKKPDLALFDLQRVEEKNIPSYRWMIKGLARLNYSLNHPAFHLQDKVKLFLAYRGKETFGILDRFLWLWIQRKEARIRRHTEKNRLKQCQTKD
jgi:hypothetical protein